MSTMSIVVSPSAALATDGTDSAARTPAVASAAPATTRPRRVREWWEVFIGENLGERTGDTPGDPERVT